MILNLQYLRGLAALLVVVFHVTDSAGRLGAGAVLPRFSAGQAGVDVFFAISGFIIWTTTRGAGDPRRFLARRFFRIAPLYWLLTLALAAVALAAPGLMGTTVFHLDHFVASLLFVPYPHPTFGTSNPFLFVGWTLNYELAFYALFALVIAAPARRHLALALGGLVALAAIGFAFGPAGAAGFYTDPIVLEFAMGVAVGAAWTRGLAPALPTSLALAAAGAALLLAGNEGPRFLVAGVPAAMIVAGAVFAERALKMRRLAPLALLGDASYSIYLTHLFTLPVAQILWRKLAPLPDGGLATLAYMAVATAACAAAGILCYRFVERPLGRLCRPLAEGMGAGGRRRFDAAASPSG